MFRKLLNVFDEHQAIACRLTERGISRRGVGFSTGSVYEILTSSTYFGQHHFNRRDSRTGAPRPPSQWVGIQVPAIIDEAMFNEVQALMQSRSPKRTPPRVVNGPTFLAGIARCGYCGSAMIQNTGKGGRLPLLLLLEQAEEGTIGLPRVARANGEAGRNRGRRGCASGARSRPSDHNARRSRPVERQPRQTAQGAAREAAPSPDRGGGWDRPVARIGREGA